MDREILRKVAASYRICCMQELLKRRKILKANIRTLTGEMLADKERILSGINLDPNLKNKSEPAGKTGAEFFRRVPQQNPRFAADQFEKS